MCNLSSIIKKCHGGGWKCYLALKVSFVSRPLGKFTQNFIFSRFQRENACNLFIWKQEVFARFLKIFYPEKLVQKVGELIYKIPFRPCTIDIDKQNIAFYLFMFYIS